MWAPAVAERNGKYYFFFGANDIHDENKEIGGIGVAVADQPDGPFRDLLSKPLVNQIRNGAHPIDPFVIDEMQFDEQGLRQPIKITREGVAGRPLVGN